MGLSTTWMGERRGRGVVVEEWTGARVGANTFDALKTFNSSPLNPPSRPTHHEAHLTARMEAKDPLVSIWLYRAQNWRPDRHSLRHAKQGGRSLRSNNDLHGRELGTTVNVFLFGAGSGCLRMGTESRQGGEHDRVALTITRPDRALDAVGGP